MKREEKNYNIFISWLQICFEICEKVMHALSGACRCCYGKGGAARVQCELLLAATFIVLC